MKKYYTAPVAETVELLHNEVLMQLSGRTDGAEEKNNVTFESASRQWSSDSWNDVDE